MNHHRATRSVDVVRCNGFTLLELIVSLAVAAILLGIAIPSYRSVVQRNSVTAQVNDLVGDLNYARSEAVTRGQTVFVCSSGDHLHCADTGNWSQGWVIYAADDPSAADPTPTASNRIRVHEPTQKTLKLTTTVKAPLSFDANGFAGSGRTFEASANGTSKTTRITIAATGRIETAPSQTL